MAIADFLKRYFPALLLGGGIIATAPVMGQARDFFFHAFPGQALRNIGIFLTTVAGALFLAAVWRIREHRLLRYGGLVLVFFLLWIQVVGFARGMAQVDVVERFHVLEYGTLAALVYAGLKRRRPAPGWLELALVPILAATLAGVLDESAQRFFQLRVADFHDVGLNAFAGLVGVLFAALLAPPRERAPALEGAPRVLRGLALTLLALGLFAAAAHFGHEVRDPELGRFRSFFDAEGLRAAAADRAARWAKQAPDGIDPWARKDLFLDEASRHTTFRNHLFESGSYAESLRANQILEKYYGPFLDAEGFRGFGRNRWPPERIAEAAAKAAAGAEKRMPASYESPVLRHHLVLVPKLPFLAGIFSACLLLLLAAARVERRRAITAG